jgi:hypothetical protein
MVNLLGIRGELRYRKTDEQSRSRIPAESNVVNAASHWIILAVMIVYQAGRILKTNSEVTGARTSAIS